MLKEFAFYLCPEIVIFKSHKLYRFVRERNFDIVSFFDQFAESVISYGYRTLFAVTVRYYSQTKVGRQQDARGEASVSRRIHRCDRCRLKEPESRVNNASAERVIICGASGRCRYQKPVTAEPLYEGAADGYVEMGGICVICSTCDDYFINAVVGVVFFGKKKYPGKLFQRSR